MKDSLTFGDNWNEIVKNQYFNLIPEISEEEFYSAVENLNTYWPEKIQESLSSYTQGPINISYTIDAGLIIGRCSKLRGFESVLRRIKSISKDSISAFSEAYVASEFAALNYAVEFEQPNSNSKKPDLLLHDENRIFAEIISPNKSEEITSLITKYEILASQLLEEFPDRKINLLCLDEPTENAENEIRHFLKRNTNGKSNISNRIFISVNKNTESIEFELSEYVPKGSLTFSIIRFRMNSKDRIQIKTTVLDERVSRFIRKEREHFSLEDCNLLIIDITGLPLEPKTWINLIKSRFRPNMNTRIGAICMFRRGHFKTTIKTEWWIEVNPHAKIPLPNSLLNNIEKLCSYRIF